jgi:hypothetical protein
VPLVVQRVGARAGSPHARSAPKVAVRGGSEDDAHRKAQSRARSTTTMTKVATDIKTCPRTVSCFATNASAPCPDHGVLRAAWRLTAHPDWRWRPCARWQRSAASSPPALVHPGAASRDDNDHATDDLDHTAVRCREDREAACLQRLLGTTRTTSLRCLGVKVVARACSPTGSVASRRPPARSRTGLFKQGRQGSTGQTSCSGVGSGCAPNGRDDVAVLCLLHRRGWVR